MLRKAIFKYTLSIASRSYQGYNYQPFSVSGVAYIFHQAKRENSSSIEAKDMAPERQFLVGGNWKMNGSRREIEDLLKNLEKADLNPEVGK